MSVLRRDGYILNVLLSTHETKRLVNGDMIQISDSALDGAKEVRIVSEGLEQVVGFHEPDPSKLYQKYYHEAGVAPKMMAAWRVIAIVLIEHFRPVNVIDFGCSGGGLGRELCSLGVDAIGIDGSGPAAEITPGKILTHDLRIADGIPWSPGTFDLAVSSDVLEHIEQQYDNVVCRLIAESVRPGGVVVVGAAVPGQGGLGHINCQPHEYWISKLEALGLCHDQDETDSLVRDIRSHEEHSECWWFSQNVHVYRKPSTPA